MDGGNQDSLFNAPPGEMRRDSQGNLVDQNNNKVAWDDTRSWASFGKAVMYYFILSLLIGLFGSGFCYLTSRGIVIDHILPTYKEFYKLKSFYSDHLF